MKKRLLSVLAAAASLMGLAAGPKIVFDTDMVEDSDDVGAMACLHALADAGKCEILAMATCTRDNQSVAALKERNAFHGRPDIPVGCAKDMDVVDAPDANEVYRKALASAPDKSVVFCSVGFLTNMRRLLETQGDAISPLDGRALVAKKVREWHVMACHVPADREYSAMHDAASTKIAFEQWPTPVVVSDWNEATVLSAVYGPTRFFEVEKGVMKFSADGTGEWTPDVRGRFLRLVPADRRERRVYTRRAVGGIIDELIARVPLCRRTDEAVVAYRRSKLEQTPTGVRMLRDGKTLWNLEIDNPEGRPFFHPLMLPGGKPLTDLRPKDHVWHLGAWFSWKFVNGVNYWEPADEKRQGAEPAGRTRVTWKRVTLDGLDCVAEMKLAYGPRAEKNPVLVEDRSIAVDPPDPNGGYTITVHHRFTAEQDAVLDRTPPHGDVKKGKWGGGYAGATLRLDAAFAQACRVHGFAGGDTPAACTGTETKVLDFTDPATGEGVTFTQLEAPASAKFYLWPDKRMINPSPVYDGPITLKKGETLELAYRLAIHATRAVKTAAQPAARPVERMDRGLVASVSPRGTYVGWRLLETDASDAAFDVWRRAGGKTEKVNAAPIVQTSDLFLPGFTDASAEYSLDGKTFVSVRCEKDAPVPFIRIPLADTNATVAAVAVGDLDGDGVYDYVVKTPAGGTDPWDLVWRRAQDTYKLEAYTSAGKFLWRKDLGWNIEMGIWYSPFIVADLDGDGRAEVVAKTAPLEPDYRDPDGRVMAGPEYLTVLDGLTGEVRAQTDWIPRAAPDPIDDYNHYNSRNQIALAHLDGRTPCVIMERGTYGKMIVDAYRFTGTALERVWRFNNEFLPSRFRGQGDHACLCEDVDGDGCDEVLIGSLTLDHDGTVLWCNGRGHSDAHYYGDIDPTRPGKELAFVYETRQRQNGGLMVADPVTGADVWTLDTPTRHVHGCGICADIDPVHPGLEIYGQEVDMSGNSKTNTHPRSDNRWFFTASGQLLCAYTNCTYRYGNGVRNAFWDADLQRELFRGGLKDHEGARCTPNVPGPMLVADLFGDWREEFVVGQKGEVRVYTTDIPAMDRRVTLMRDPSYRSRITMWPSGYDQQPILQYVPSAVSPNVSVRFAENARRVRLDVTAPLDRPLKGELSVRMPENWRVEFDGRIDLPPGGVWSKDLPIRRPPNPRGRYDATATLTRPGAPALVVRQPLVM